MPYNLAKALGYAVLIWITGFVWGTIVFLIPSLWNISPIPYISSNPAISFPILIMWLILSYFLAKNYLHTADDKATEGLKLGLTFSLVNVFLDLLVVVFLFGAGFGFYVSLTVWTAYFMLLVIPWLTGRSLQRGP